MALLNFNTGSGQLDALLSSTASSMQNGGSLGSAASSTISGLISPYTSLLGIVGLGGAFQKTFGNILANGFNISCWGSSKDPAKIKAILTTNYKPYFDNLLSSLQNGQEIDVNRFINDVYITHNIAVIMQTATKWDSCSKKGLALYLEFLNPLKAKADELITAFVNAGATRKDVKTSSFIKLASYQPEGADMNRKIDIPVLAFKTIKQETIQTKSVIKTTPAKLPSSNDLDKQPTFDGGELNNVNVDDKTPKATSSFPWWILLLGAGMM